MIDATANRAEGATAFDFSRVHTCRIHPGIGIARVGNSPDEYFIGPEAPCRPRDVTAPSGGFKDEQGRVKRQAARFRIYAYDSEGKFWASFPCRVPTTSREARTPHRELKCSGQFISKTKKPPGTSSSPGVIIKRIPIYSTTQCVTATFVFQPDNYRTIGASW
jgi:hypothetical protein